MLNLCGSLSKKIIQISGCGSFQLVYTGAWFVSVRFEAPCQIVSNRVKSYQFVLKRNVSLYHFWSGRLGTAECEFMLGHQDALFARSGWRHLRTHTSQAPVRTN